jgi:hypothetical protein
MCAGRSRIRLCRRLAELHALFTRAEYPAQYVHFFFFEPGAGKQTTYPLHQTLGLARIKKAGINRDPLKMEAEQFDFLESGRRGNRLRNRVRLWQCHAQFVRHHLHRAGEIKGGVVRIGGDMYDDMALADLEGGEAGHLRAKDDCDVPSPGMVDELQCAAARIENLRRQVAGTSGNGRCKNGAA